MKKIIKLFNRILNFIKKKDGFSLLEVIIGVTIFTISMTSIVFCFSTIIQIELKSKERIYKKINEANEVSKRYYIKKEFDL